ncbi:MAG TPA: anti-sigma factor, partial [Ornithinibacter sp.]|nr:anti-sigma factor [Ornithinibacter sp.]
SVLAGIAQVRPLPPLTEENEAEPDAVGTVVPIRRRRGTAWFAAAAAAAVIAVGGVAWSPWSDDTASRSPMAQVSAATDVMTVRSTKGGVTTEVAYSKQLGKAAISVTGLPPAPDGKTYQLWYVGPDGAATSAGLLGVDAEGSGQALMAGSATPEDTVAMTVEPAGGSAQPTTEPVVALALA